ncbi:histidine phosphatase family protein [Streptomyces sp. SCSIO 30461]|uniref:histidine phosphatase family protein n=1 Tax=Streptomyces sp. SCSIO 30461 TaxID=3118085 RepID=UPI0030CCDD2D
MSVRLTLLCAAAGPSVRGEARFGGGSLDERAVHEAEAARSALPAAPVVLRAPSVRCGQTADALGLDASVEPRLRDLDHGSWQGRSLTEVLAGVGPEAGPEAVRQWTTDPAAAPHGGESVRELCLRIGGWLDSLPGDLPQDTGRRVLAVVEPSVVRAAGVYALGAPLPAFWRLDVPPLSGIGLTWHGGRWNLRLVATAPTA